MKKLSFFLMAMILSFAASIQAAEVTETIAMKKFGGLSTSSYENVTKTGTSDLGTEMVAYAFNPSTGQVRGNKTTIAGASVTSADKNKNWSLYNNQAMPGAIKSITVTQTATGSNKFQNNMYVALGTTNQGAVTTVSGAQKNTTTSATKFTFDIDETQGYTYFKLLSNEKFTSNSVEGVVVTVTYVTSDENPDETKYTVTTKVNDETMGTVTGAGEYAEGKTATLTANPNTGYKFVNWSNGETANPLKLTVTENVEITANFAVIPPMTCAEAAATASGETVVLNPFDVVYVVKDAGYIYIKDESGVNLIYDYNLDDKLKAGDHVEGFVGVSSPYNNLPELKASVSYNELTVTPGTAPEPTLFTAAPTKADVNKYVKFENVTLTANATFTTSSATNATMVVNGTNVTLRNNFKLAATLSADKAYNIVGFAAIYNSTIQVYFLSAEEYVVPVVNHVITVSANPAEAGVVTGGGEFEETDEITVTATANEGYEFVNWTENDEEVSTEAEYTFEVLADRNLVANFVALPAPEVKSGKFSVGENKLATFAPGNLQFNTGDSTWRFAYEQYNVVGAENINLGDLAFKGWIDMFGWSTAETYYGVNPSNSNELYDGEFVDWGNVFEGENWSTLSADEWNYLLKTRANAAALKQVATVDTVLGIMLFPDAWVMPEGIEVAAKVDTAYDVNIYNYTIAQWDVLEEAGAIFLPAAGRRTGGYGNMINYDQQVETREDYLVNGGFYRWQDNTNIYCYYWTSTIDENKNVSYLNNIVALGNDEYTIGTGAIWGEKGRYGQSVRLAQIEIVNNTETVYFINNKGWSKVNVYAWEPQNANWPGVEATKEAEQIAGYDVYSFTAEAGKYANVIFNNGSGQQTADLKWTAGKYVINNQWYTKEEAEVALAKPVEYEYVYFVDNQGWGKANIYTWTPEVGTWPGVAMTKEAEQLAGYDVYSYKAEKGTSFGGIIFNNGSGVQTGDLKWTAGKYYVKDAWYTKEEAEAKLAGPVTPPTITYVLMGIAGDWNTGVELTANPDNANEYMLLGQDIAEGDAVKVVTLTDGVATAWCGNVDEYSVEHSLDTMGNIILAPGKYDFYYKVTEDIIYIGAVAPTYETMELTMTNLQVSDYGNATGLWASDMDNGIEVMLFLDAEGNLMEESSIMVSWMDYTVTGTVTKAYDEELATDVYTAELYTTVGETNYKLIITMYYVPVEATPVVVENATIDDQTETSGFMFMTGEWTDAEGVVYPVSAEVPGFDATVAEAVYSNVTVTVGGWGDEDPWLGFVQGDATITVVENVVTLTGVMSSWDGLTLDVTISGSLPAIAPETITWELNGGELPTVEVPTNEELWEAFKPYYNEYYGLARADQPIDKVSTFAAAKMQEIMTDAASEYKWLGDYILEVAAGQGVNLPTDMAAANEGAWRWAVHAFFNATTGANGAAGTDFTEAGKPENWGPAYQAVHEVVLPTTPQDTDYTLPTPIKEGYIFVGWYDNAEGVGEAYTVIPAGWYGKLYAIWKQDSTTDLDNNIFVEQPVKILRDGQVLIMVGDKTFNMMGQEVK